MQSEFEVSQGGVTPPGARREADVAPDFEKKVTVLWSLEKNVERKERRTELALNEKERRTEKNVERNWP